MSETSDTDKNSVQSDALRAYLAAQIQGLDTRIGLLGAEENNTLQVGTRDEVVHALGRAMTHLTEAHDLLEPSHEEKLPEVKRLSGLEMSDDEVTMVGDVVKFLSAFEERLPLKDILKSVLGGSGRLAKDRENRIVTLLNAYTAEGLLRAYGKTYGYRTEAERLAMVGAGERGVYIENPELESFDVDAVELVTQLSDGGKYEVNIGQIVRSLYRVQTVDPAEFKQVIARLNYLADNGYLVHADGSPWYNLGARPIRLLEEAVASMPEKRLDSSEEPEAAERSVSDILPEVIEAANDASIMGEALQIDDEEAKLRELFTMPTDRQQAMFEVLIGQVRVKGWFQFQDVDFGEVEFVSEGAKRQAFNKLMDWLAFQKIVKVEGDRRDKRYRLLRSPLSAERFDMLHPDLELEEQDTIPDEEEEAAPLNLAAPEGDPAFDQVFTEKLSVSLGAFLAESDTGRRRLKDVTRFLADSHGVPAEHARFWINEVVKAGGAHLNGQAGMRMLVRGPAPARPAHQTGESGREDPKAWSQADVSVATRVFSQLLEFRHVQQGIDIKDIIRSIGKPDDEKEIRKSLRRLADKGYITLEQSNTFNLRSDHSKRVTATLVKLASQDIKNRIKNDPSAVRAELESYIG